MRLTEDLAIDDGHVRRMAERAAESERRHRFWRKAGVVGMLFDLVVGAFVLLCAVSLVDEVRDLRREVARVERETLRELADLRMRLEVLETPRGELGNRGFPPRDR